MPEDLTPIVVEPGQGRLLQGPAGGPLLLKVVGAQTGGSLTAIENVIAPGDGPPLHLHEATDESWYVLDGLLRFRLGEEEAHASTGSFVFVPRGVVHAFQNVGEEPARLLIVFTPSGMEQFFEEFSALPEDADPAPEFARIGAKVGMEVVGPPLRAVPPAAEA